MSVQSFNPTIWAANLLENLYNDHVFANCVNRDYEGEIKGYGSSVKINGIGPVTVRDYTRNTDIAAPDDLDMADQVLLIDQGKYFHFAIDDVDARQARADFKADGMKEASQAISETIDDFMASTIGTGVDGTSNDITNGTPLTVGQGAGEVDAFGVTEKLAERLDVAKCPSSNRWLVAPPFFLSMLRLDSRFSGFNTPRAADIIRGRPIGEISGFTVYKSNNCPAGASSSTVVLAGYKGAVTYAEQIAEMSAYKPERRFGDAVKGLHVYGMKVTRPNCLAAAEVLSGTFYQV